MGPCKKHTHTHTQHHTHTHHELSYASSIAGPLLDDVETSQIPFEWSIPWKRFGNVTKGPLLVLYWHLTKQQFQAPSKLHLEHGPIKNIYIYKNGQEQLWSTDSLPAPLASEGSWQDHLTRDFLWKRSS